MHATGAIKTNSLERKIKSLIPTNLKRCLANLICSDISGFIIKKSGVKRNMFGGVYNYALVNNKTAAKIFFGTWESAEIRFSKRFVQAKNVVELGSSVGATLGVLSHLHPNMAYVCVEASPRNFKILSEFRKSLPDSSDITLINRAICYNKDSEFVSFSETTYSGSRLSYLNTDKKSNDVKVKAVSLKDILQMNNITDSYTLITDIEGAEADIFFEDSRSLEKCTSIVCELEDTEKYSLNAQIKQLYKLGFKIVEQYGNVFYFSK